MFHKLSVGLVTLALLAASVSVLPQSIAQTPYWDNSDGNQPYYNPNTYGGNQGYNSGYPQQQQNYGQPQSNYGQSQPNYGQGYGQQSLHGYVSTVPAGTSMSVSTTNYLSSQNARIGDPVMVTLGYDLAIGGKTILPGGSQIQGEVVSSIPAGRAGRYGQLQLRFHRAMLPDGRVIPLSARLITQDGSGIIRGGVGSSSRVGNVTKNTLGGAAIGAATGTAFGALVGGKSKWNEGLMWGSILGAAGGMGRSVIQQGEEAELQPGTQLQIMLDQPLTSTTGGGGGGQMQNNYSGYPY